MYTDRDLDLMSRDTAVKSLLDAKAIVDHHKARLTAHRAPDKGIDASINQAIVDAVALVVVRQKELDDLQARVDLNPKVA